MRQTMNKLADQHFTLLKAQITQLQRDKDSLIVSLEEKDAELGVMRCKVDDLERELVHREKEVAEMDREMHMRGS